MGGWAFEQIAPRNAAWVAQKVTQVTTNKLDGVFFDFEGHLDNKQKSSYSTLAQETSDALRPLNASIFVCVGARPSYEFRNYDYQGLANASDFLFIMVSELSDPGFATAPVLCGPIRHSAPLCGVTCAHPFPQTHHTHARAAGLRRSLL